MNVPLVHYRSLRAKKELAPAAGTAVKIIGEEHWSSAAPADRKLKLIVEVDGDIKDEGRSIAAIWYFEWPTKDLSKLEIALEAIVRHGREATPSGTVESEAYTDVYDWLRIGYREQPKKGTYYIDFTKGGHRLRAAFADAAGLNEFKDALRFCSDGGKGMAAAVG